MTEIKNTVTPDRKNTGLSRRTALKGAATAAAASLPLFNINHSWSADVSYNGEIFDAGGATLRLAEWGGFWEELQRKLLLDQFEKDFNCKIQYDSAFPWFPKFVAGGVKSPVYDSANWNVPEMFKTARAGDFFMPIDEVQASVPTAKELWPFAFKNGVGVTWAFGQYCHAYRTDLVDLAPKTFKDFWEDRFKGARGTYVTANTLFMDFFIVSSYVFGGDQKNLDAGYDAMKRAMPMKISDFTGNMQTLLERGECRIAVLVDGEVYMMMDKGIKVAPWIWTERQPILSQNVTISRYSEPIQKKLSLALLNRRLSAPFMTEFDKVFYLRPTNKNVVVPENLASKGVKNTAEATDGFWVPDWNFYLDNEDDIVERVNQIFAG